MSGFPRAGDEIPTAGPSGTSIDPPGLPSSQSMSSGSAPTTHRSASPLSGGTYGHDGPPLDRVPESSPEPDYGDFLCDIAASDHRGARSTAVARRPSVEPLGSSTLARPGTSTSRVSARSAPPVYDPADVSENPLPTRETTEPPGYREHTLPGYSVFHTTPSEPQLADPGNLMGLQTIEEEQQRAQAQDATAPTGSGRDWSLSSRKPGP